MSKRKLGYWTIITPETGNAHHGVFTTRALALAWAAKYLKPGARWAVKHTSHFGNYAVR